MARRHEKAMTRLDKLIAERVNRVNRERELGGFIDTIVSSDVRKIEVLPNELSAWGNRVRTDSSLR
jgi:hypothetical protein